MKLYKENKEGNIIERTFDQSVNELDLVWHRDYEDRKVVSIDKTDWKIQLDESLPQSLNEEVLIPKGTYHRVIKGTGDLNVRIEIS